MFQGCVRAMEKTWHMHHFSCYSCDKQFSAECGYHEHEEKPYCEKCYTEIALPKCQGCKKPITDKAINAMGGPWHLTCFVCKVSQR